MNVTIPDDAVGGLLHSPEEARLELAVALYADGRATLGRAAKIAGLAQLDLQRELCRRRVPMHYGAGEFTEDLETIRTMPQP